MTDFPNFVCPHCSNNSWKKNDVSSAIMGISPSSETSGKPSGKYMEAISYLCGKCGYIVFFRIP